MFVWHHVVSMRVWFGVCAWVQVGVQISAREVVAVTTLEAVHSLLRDHQVSSMHAVYVERHLIHVGVRPCISGESVEEDVFLEGMSGG